MTGCAHPAVEAEGPNEVMREDWVKGQFSEGAQKHSHSYQDPLADL